MPRVDKIRQQLRDPRYRKIKDTLIDQYKAQFNYLVSEFEKNYVLRREETPAETLNLFNEEFQRFKRYFRKIVAAYSDNERPGYYLNDKLHSLLCNFFDVVDKIRMY